jgi:cell division septation protein DedD
VSEPRAASGSARTLSRDFKHVRKHTPMPHGHAFNAWVGLGVGLSVGLAVALAVHLHYRHRLEAAAATAPVATAAPLPASATATDEPIEAPPDEGGFDFYNMLPKQEVEVPDNGKGTAPRASTSPLPTGGAILQAGAFNKSIEAEKLVAELARNGITATIHRAPLEDETWYRVRIGPIATVEELEATRAKLRDLEIEATRVTPREDLPPP